jgi:hypothetical protein
MADKFIRLINGNNANDGSTFVLAKQSPSQGGSAGDRWKLEKSPDPTACGTATWTNNSSTVTFAVAPTKVVTNCETAWTAANGNVTCLTSGTRNQGSNSARIDIAAAFTTGKVAHFPTGTLDLSGHQQINFQINSTSSIAANTFRIDLCSDTTGDVPVHSFTIDRQLLTGSNNFQGFVYDNGSALNSSIKSVTIVALLDPSASSVTILIDNIFVSKGPTAADCLTLYSIICEAQNPTGEQYWFQPICIVDNVVTLHGFGASGSSNLTSYRGTTKTVTTYVRQTILMPSNISWIPSASGTAASPITFSGGWDPADNMATQNGETWIYTPRGQTQFLFVNNFNYIRFEKVGITNGVATNSGGSSSICVNNGIGITFTNCWFLCSNYYSDNATLNVTFTNCRFIGFGGISNISTGAFAKHLFDSCMFLTSGTASLGNLVANWIFRNCTWYNPAFSISTFQMQQNEPSFINCTFKASTAFNTSTAGYSVVGCHNCLFAGSAASNVSTQSISNGRQNSRVRSGNHNQVNGAHFTVYPGGTWGTTTATRHTASGFAWQMSVTDSTYFNSDNPLEEILGAFYVKANKLVTIKCWVRRSNTTNVTASIKVPAYYCGLTQDVETVASGAVNTFQEETITFTPTLDGVVPLYAKAMVTTGGSAFFDDISFSQAE